MLKYLSSYSGFINRLKNKRKNDQDKEEKQNNRVGGGQNWDKWNKKQKNYDFNYDYTAHVISEGNLNETLQKVINNFIFLFRLILQGI